jgi:rhamnulokinase
VRAFGAVDIGNSGLRVMLGTLDQDRLALREVTRVPNAPVLLADGWHWDAVGLVEAAVAGLAEADAITPLDAIAVDTWGVDYGLLDEQGRLLGPPFSYRDERSLPMVAVARERIGAADLYALTGCQDMPINSVYQLLADDIAGRLDAAACFLLMDDLVHHRLSGVIGADETNASTTGLFNPTTRDWSWTAIEAVRLPDRLFAPVQRTGAVLGESLPGSNLRPGIPIVTAAGHDTAAAWVAGADMEDALVVSLGTWSLVGVELNAPLVTEAGRLANFTNEIGVLGTIRFLRNAAGMWILQECLREWREMEPDLTWAHVIAEAERCQPFAHLIDPDNTVFMAPGPMASRVATAGEGRKPTERGPVVRAVLESLALSHRWLLESAQSVLGRRLTSIRIVGGGSQNRALCQMMADATGLPVVAGPVEATALGNVAMQAIALGAIDSLEEARAMLRASYPQERFEASTSTEWEAAYRRWRDLANR